LGVGLFKGDDIMAYAPLALTLNGFVIPQTPARKGPGLFARALAALVAARQVAAEREIARYVNASGGKFTDDMEREIERRFLSTPSNW
jgi:hypothetical protein